MMYRVLLTEQAKQDLRDIYEYVAFSLVEPDVAGRLINRISAGLRSLREMPYRYPVFQEEPWKKQRSTQN